MRIILMLSMLLCFFSGSAQQAHPQDKALSAPSIKFFPNPAITVITFDFPKAITEEKEYSFQIYNFLGKKVFEQKNLQPRTTVELSQYFRGIYIFQLRDKTGKILESGRFQVNK